MSYLLKSKNERSQGKKILLGVTGNLLLYAKILPAFLPLHFFNYQQPPLNNEFKKQNIFSYSFLKLQTKTVWKKPSFLVECMELF